MKDAFQSQEFSRQIANMKRVVEQVECPQDVADRENARGKRCVLCGKYESELLEEFNMNEGRVPLCGACRARSRTCLTTSQGNCHQG